MKKEIDRMNRAFLNYQLAVDALNTKVKQICDFNAVIVHQPSDGHLVLNEETSNVALLSCLEGRSRSNKLTEDEHEKFCI